MEAVILFAPVGWIAPNAGWHVSIAGASLWVGAEAKPSVQVFGNSLGLVKETQPVAKCDPPIAHSKFL